MLRLLMDKLQIFGLDSMREWEESSLVLRRIKVHTRDTALYIFLML